MNIKARFNIANINSLQTTNFSDWSKIKALADDNLNATENFKSVLEMVENIAVKRENASNQYFLLFP